MSVARNRRDLLSQSGLSGQRGGECESKQDRGKSSVPAHNGILADPKAGSLPLDFERTVRPDRELGLFWLRRYLLCGAANPGCNRLSAGSLRIALSLPQETLPRHGLKLV